jgi:YHS domain-containing protein
MTLAMTAYYEHDGTTYYLLSQGSIQEFRSKEQMMQFINDESVLLIEVTPENWNDLYEQGAFDV